MKGWTICTGFVDIPRATASQERKNHSPYTQRESVVLKNKGNKKSKGISLVLRSYQKKGGIQEKGVPPVLSYKRKGGRNQTEMCIRLVSRPFLKAKA